VLLLESWYVGTFRDRDLYGFVDALRHVIRIELLSEQTDGRPDDVVIGSVVLFRPTEYCHTNRDLRNVGTPSCELLLADVFQEGA
jgi:hypothetical protein